MATGKAIVIWSETQPSLGANSPQELDAALDEITAKFSVKMPNAVTIEMHGYQVAIGLGLPLSFVHIVNESGEPPYEITVGDADSDGVVAFFLHGHHHSEIECRNLIPTPIAREVIREFFEVGRRSDKVAWEEV